MGTWSRSPTKATGTQESEILSIATQCVHQQKLRLGTKLEFEPRLLYWCSNQPVYHHSKCLPPLWIVWRTFIFTTSHVLQRFLVMRNKYLPLLSGVQHRPLQSCLCHPSPRILWVSCRQHVWNFWPFKHILSLHSGVLWELIIFRHPLCHADNYNA